MSQTPTAIKKSYSSHNENIFNQNILGISEKPTKRVIVRQPSKDHYDLSSSPCDKTLIASIKNENMSLQATINKLNEDVKQLKQENAKLKQNSNQISTMPNIQDEGIYEKYQNALVKIQNYESTLCTKDRIIDELKHGNHENEDKIVKLNQKIEKKKNQISKLQQQLNEIAIKGKESLPATCADQSSISGENDASNDKHGQLFSLLKTIQIHEFEFRQQKAIQNKSINLCNRLLELTQEYEDRITMNKEEAAAQDEVVEKMTKANEALRKSLDSIKQQNTEYQAEIINLKTKQLEDSILTLGQNSGELDSQILAEKAAIDECHSIISKQTFIIDTLTTYIIRVLTENDTFIPLLYQSEPIISDIGIRNFVIESIKSLKNSLYKTNKRKDEPQNPRKFEEFDKEEMYSLYDHKNELIASIFNSFEDVEKFINRSVFNESCDNGDLAILIALCAANSNLGSRIQNINSELEDMIHLIPGRFEYDTGMTAFEILRNYLSDSKELFNKMFRIVDDSEILFDFGSTEMKEILKEVLMEVSIFANKMKSVCTQYKFRGVLSDFPEAFIEYNETLQNELAELRMQCQNSDAKFIDGNRVNETQKGYIDELIEKNNQLNQENEEKETLIAELKSNLNALDQELASIRSDSEQILSKMQETIEEQRNQIGSMQIEIDQKTIVLSNTRKMHKAQIEETKKSEREKYNKEIAEIMENQKEIEERLEKKAIAKKQLKADISKLQEKIESMSIKYTVLLDQIQQKDQNIELLDLKLKETKENCQNRINSLTEQLWDEPEQVAATLVAASHPPVDKETVIFLNQLIPLVGNLTNATIAFDPNDQNSIENAKIEVLLKLRRFGIIHSNNSKRKLMQKNSPANELSKWTTWAIDLASKMKIQAESPMFEIRTAISDVVLSQVAKCAMLKLIQSLRIQKKFLTTYDLSDKNRKLNIRNATLKNVISVILALRAIQTRKQ